MWLNNSWCIFIILFIKVTLSCKNVQVWIEHLQTIKTYMNFQVNPCDNFYKFACGNWEIVTENQSEDTLKFSEKKLLDSVKNILEDEKIKFSSISAQKVRNLFLTCKKENSTKEQKFRIYKSALEIFGSWPVIDNDWTEDDFDWIHATAFLRTYGVNALIREDIKPNWNDSSQNIIYLSQPKFTFISRNDLVDPSLASNEYIFLYKRYIKYLMLDLGCKIKQAKRIADEIFNFEIKLANITENENNIPIPKPKTLENSFEMDWKKYLNTVLDKSVKSSTVLAVQVNYFEKLVNLIETSQKETIAMYLLFKFMLNFNVGLQDDQEIHDVTSKCVKNTSNMMGPVLEYMQYDTSEQNANNFENMFIQLKSTFHNILKNATWLDNTTRNQAENKLEKMQCDVGLPLITTTQLDYIYEHFHVNLTNYHQTLLNFAQFKVKYDHKSIEDSDIFPLMSERSTLNVNAFYKLTQNKLKIPIGLMKQPFYDECFPEAWTFGSLGSMLGHEIMHAFDFEGRNYDALGNIRDWWSPKSFIGYFSKADCLIEQHNNFTASRTSGLHTLSENIADNGGLKLSYQTYQQVYPDDSKKHQSYLENLTNSQLFFVSFAQTWCSRESETNVLGRRHSSHKWRVIGVLSNFPQFSDAFDCPTGSKMNPENKCEMW